MENKSAKQLKWHHHCNGYCNGYLECRGNFTPQPTPFFWFSLRFLVLQQGGQMLFCHIGTHVNLLYSQQDCSGVPAKTTHLSTELGSHCKLLSFSPLDVDHIQVRTKNELKPRYPTSYKKTFRIITQIFLAKAFSKSKQKQWPEEYVSTLQMFLSLGQINRSI